VDIVRPPQKKTGRNIAIAGGVAVLALITWGLSQLQPAAPTVELAMQLTDSVRRGDLTREVRGNGTLVPERIRWISPLASGRVERIVTLSGESLNAGDVILEMSSPDQQIATMNAQQRVRQAQLDLANLRNSVANQKFTQEIAVASARTQNMQAQQEATQADSLIRVKLISQFDANRIKAQAEEAATRFRIAQQQLQMVIAVADSQLAVAEANIADLRTIAANEETRLRSLIVRAPEAGVLQDMNLQPGQWVQSGTTVARVVQPGKLKAVLRIPESQARDVQIGHPASVDIRSGGVVVHGKISRKDAAAQGGSVQVDVTFEGELPPGAVPDMNVDGTIQVEQLRDVLWTGRPTSGAATGTIGMFKIVEDGKYAIRVPVQLGQSSVNAVVILNGLQVGDRVIISAMDQFDNVDRVRIR
jgi:multidrug resistance efflux pump